MKRFLSGALCGGALVAAALGGMMMVEAGNSEGPQQGLWADACVFIVQDASLQFPGWGYGSIKYVGGFVGNYDGSFLTDYAAQQAISGFDCKRSY